MLNCLKSPDRGPNREMLRPRRIDSATSAMPQHGAVVGRLRLRGGGASASAMLRATGGQYAVSDGVASNVLNRASSTQAAAEPSAAAAPSG